MTENVSTTEVYLHYFVQIIDFEEKVKNNYASMTHFEIVPYISDELKDVEKSANTKIKGKHRSFLAKNNSKVFNKSESVANSKLMKKNNFNGSFSQRIEMTKTMLEDFNDHCSSEESYEKYLAKLIDFEEGMI